MKDYAYPLPLRRASGEAWPCGCWPGRPYPHEGHCCFAPGATDCHMDAVREAIEYRLAHP